MNLDDLTRGPHSDPSSVFRYRDGVAAVDLLAAAILHLDFFTWLDGQTAATAADVCRHFDLAARPTDVMLTLFVANDYIERRDDTFVLTPTGREHLTSTSPFSLVSYFAPMRERPLVSGFLRVLRTDTPAQATTGATGADWHTAMEAEGFARAFTAAMDCRGRQLAPALVRAVAVGGRRRLLDIGGGSGIYACTFAAANPDLTATVIEQPPVDRLARDGVAAWGVGGRVAVTSADFLTDDWPHGHDIHLFSNVLHDWGPSTIERLLARSYEAMDPDGLLIVHESFINRDKTGPLPVAEYSALLMHITQGKCYATSEYESLFEAAGFTDVAYLDTVNDRGVMTARKR